MGRKDKQPQSLSGSQSGSRQYVQWNTNMDKALAAVLYDQLAQDNKEDRHWKNPTYQVAMEYINTQLNLNLTKENIKNRLKAWKLHFAIIIDIKKKKIKVGLCGMKTGKWLLSQQITSQCGMIMFYHLLDYQCFNVLAFSYEPHIFRESDV